MKRIRFIIFLSLALFTCQLHAQVNKVTLLEKNNGWQLLRNGVPYYVKGAGGHTQLDQLVEIGGNSIRTWSADDAQEILDAAHSRGLTVMMGLWVQHERHGFDYNNKAAVKKQLEKFRAIVEQIKDHPALLIWGIGNEVDLAYSNTKVWYAINDIAKMIHELDPNHPTTTITAGFDPKEAKLIMERAPEIDIYSINTYGDIGNVRQALKASGWPGPYMITEWGPDGHWEVKKTTWDAPIEQSSSEKAISYARRYQEHIAPHSDCLGSYIFLWGQKQETTETWYGLFSKDGHKTEVLDKMSLIWKRTPLENSAPKLDSLQIEQWKKGDEIILIGGKKYQAQVFSSDPDNDALTISWRIDQESTSDAIGGDFEQSPLKVPGAIKSSVNNEVIFKAPITEGAYRLMVFVYDNQGHVAYDNIPIYSLPSNEVEVEGVQFKHYTLDSFENNPTTILQE